MFHIESKYDELAGNTTITGLTQPFDPSARTVESAPAVFGVCVCLR